MTPPPTITTRAVVGKERSDIDVKPPVAAGRESTRWQVAMYRQPIACAQPQKMIVCDRIFLISDCAKILLVCG